MLYPMSSGVQDQRGDPTMCSISTCGTVQGLLPRKKQEAREEKGQLAERIAWLRLTVQQRRRAP